MVLALLTQNLARQRKRILSLGFQAKYLAANTTSKRTSSSAFRSVGVSGLVQIQVFRVDLWTSWTPSTPLQLNSIDLGSVQKISAHFKKQHAASHHLSLPPHSPCAYIR